MTGMDSVDTDLKAKLLAPRAATDSGMPEDSVDIPGIGTVKVRGLSRGEVFVIKKVAKGDDDMERKILVRALLDPVMSEEEVRGWQTVSVAGELEEVTDKINELSGLSEGADKSGVPAAGDDD